MLLHFGLIGSTVLLPSTLLTLINILSNKSRMSTNLFLKSHTFYLLYRSEKSDTKLGGESKCFQMRYYEAGRGKEEFMTQLLFRDNSTGQMDVYSIVIVLEKSNESLKYYDRLVAQNYIATRYETYDLLFTDYQTCFTLRRISDDLHQVWMIDRRNASVIDPGCESAYQGPVNEYGCAVPKPKYDIFDPEICQ
uniref:Putative salivary lipocalin n=1 Tax=Ixodes ricinus TaxID=34613 RepID=A0A0K8R9C7_IXORI